MNGFKFIFILSLFFYVVPSFAEHSLGAIKTISIPQNAVLPEGGKIVALGKDEFYILGKNDALPHHILKRLSEAPYKNQQFIPIKVALRHGKSNEYETKKSFANYKEIAKFTNYKGKKVKIISFVALGKK